MAGEAVEFERQADIFTNRKTGNHIVELEDDTDIIAKARFPNYAALKKFIVDDVAGIEGVKENKTFMVVTTFKERGKVREPEEEQKE